MNIHGIHYLLLAAVLLYILSGLFVLLKKRQPAFLLLCAGVAAHIVYQILRGWLAGIFIAGGMFDSVFLLPFIVAALALIKQSFSVSRPDWDSVVFLSVILGAFALWYPHGIIPPNPQKTILLANFFFIFEVAAHACFFIGGWFALRTILHRGGTNEFHTLLVTGFILYSLAQFVGAAWSYQGWASPFRWGTRHLNSAAIWFTYAAYLHLRFLKGWDTKRKAWFAFAAALLVVYLSFGSYLHELPFERIGG